MGELIQEQRPYQNWSASSGAQEIMVDYLYDALGRQSRVGTPWLTARYSSGDLRRSAYWSGGYTQTTYDPIDRPAVITAPNGEQQTYTYAGRAYSLIGTGRNGDPNKVLKWEERDGLGNLKYVRTYNPNGSSWTVDAQVTLTYDVLGNLTSVSHPNSIGTTSLGYDLAGRKLWMSDPDLGYWSYAYDRQGKLTRQTDARWATICLYYDSLARLAGKHFRWDTNCPASPSYNVSYGYDANHGATNRSRGQLTSVSNGSYSKALTYEARGLLALETVTIAGAPQSYNTYYAADTYLRPTTIIYPDGEVVTTSYNSMGLPNRLHSSWQYGYLVDGTTASGGITNGVNYDEAGRLRNMRFPLDGNLWQSYDYYPWNSTNAYSRSISDSNGRRRLVYVGTNPYWGDRYGSHYSYDSHSNVTVFEEWINNATVTTAAFSYDVQNRLTAGYGRGYSYDSAGRLTHYEGVNQTVNSSFPGHAIKNSGYSYDNNGNVLTRSNGQSLTWDHENRLSSVTGSGVNDSFLYDADGQRVKKTSNGSSIYYPNQYYEQYGGTNVDKYYYFNGQPVALWRNGALYYLHQDQLGNLALVTAGGTRVDDQGFYAYGRLRRGIIGVERSFTGQQKDFSSGLIYMKARYYDPELGQFLSPDSLVPDPGTLFDYNRYMYTRGNPMRYNDPTGHCATLDNGGADWEGDHDCWTLAYQIYGYGLTEQQFAEDWQVSPDAWLDNIAKASFADVNYLTPFFTKYHAISDAQTGQTQGVPNPVTDQDQAFDQFHARYAPDCNEIDCVTHSLDALGTVAALFGVGCAVITWGTCGLAATAVGGVTGVAGVVWTAYQVNEGNSTEVDLVVTGTTLTIGAAKEGNPWVNLGASLFQWAWDYRNPMADK